MNKRLGHLLVLVAFVGLSNGLDGGAGGIRGLGKDLAGGPGEGGASGSVGGTSNAGAGGSASNPSRSGPVGSARHPAAKNSSLGFGSSSGGGAGAVGGSSSGSEGLGGHPLSGGSGSAGSVTVGSSSGASGTSGSTRSPSSLTSGPELDLTRGFGDGHGGVGVAGEGDSDFGGERSGSIVDNLNSGFGSSRGGAPRAAGRNAAGAGRFGGDRFSGGDLGFESDIGQTWGFSGTPGSSFITRGSFTGGPGFEEGSPGELGAWGSAGNSNSGAGAPGEGTDGFGGFNGGSEFGSFDSGEPPYGIPEGAGGGLGTDERGNVGGAGPFSSPIAQPEPGDFLDSQAGHGSPFTSSSGVVGSSTDESHNDIGSSNPDASVHPSGSFAHVLRGFQHQRMFSGLWQSGRTGRGPFGLGQRRRKTDPRVAAAVALGTVAGLAAIGSLGAGIAAALLSRRRSSVADIGGARRGCASGNCRRNKRSILVSKVPAHILNSVSLDFERLY